jgi:hypothetical protein
MSEALTGIGCRGCPVGAEYGCFTAIEDKKGMHQSHELTKIWGEDIVPIRQEFQEDGETVYASNGYADEFVPLCENGQFEEDGKTFDQCPNENAVKSAVVLLELAGCQKITGEA